MQAEAVADLIDAVTPLQARAAFDQLDGTLTRAIARDRRGAVRSDRAARGVGRFSRRGLSLRRARRALAQRDRRSAARRSTRCSPTRARGRLIREGLQVAIVGAPNVGKSSLFNALAGAARAIVTDVPGTTRDLVTERVDIDGLRVRWSTRPACATSRRRDRSGRHRARAAGARRSRTCCSSCSIGREPLTATIATLLDETAARPRVVVANKSDLPPAWDATRARRDRGVGADRRRARRAARARSLRARRRRAAARSRRRSPTCGTSRWSSARTSALRARATRRRRRRTLPEEFVLADLHEARGRARGDHRARARRTMCSRTSSSGSASANKSAIRSR